MCLELFTLHSPAGVLSGVICLHVDDMLGTGDELFESKLKQHDKFLGFGSITAEGRTRNMPMVELRFP